MATTPDSWTKILAAVPGRFRGPGGAVAVLKDGELVGKQLWGYADLHRRTLMTADTVLPICSITKQMLCGLLTDLERNPTPAMAARSEGASKQLSDELAKVLKPKLAQSDNLSLRLLCNNQSGIRDYWALTVLWGTKPEGKFSIVDHGPQMLDKMQSLHFEPGTEYSYANTNFFIVARVIETVTGQSLAELLEQRIFTPAGMKTTKLCADTFTHPGPGIGYEGNEDFGFYPGENRIEWAGDAGIVASLDDMIAYEQFVDRSRDDPNSWYHSNSQQQKFADGTPADYGYGLGRHNVGDVLTVGHGGALRGYRLYRMYAPGPRISIVVLLNQEHGEPGAVSEYIFKKALSIPEPEKKEGITANPDWEGTFLDPESQLAVVVTKKGAAPGEILLQYHRKPLKMRLEDADTAKSDTMTASINGDSVHLSVPTDNRDFHAKRVLAIKEDADVSDLQGDFHCAEIDSTFHLTGTSGMLYGSFDGFLGQGPVHLVRLVAQDVLLLACPRAMDSTPPGNWTIVVRRDDSGKVSGVTIGCWLARKLDYVKTS